jgi:hypothetical protein
MLMADLADVDVDIDADVDADVSRVGFLPPTLLLKK